MSNVENLFITGMFRSGTTLLTRMLNTHKYITVAADPYAPIFKQLRNELAKKIFENDFDINMPLDDYYFDKDKNNLFSLIQKLDLKQESIDSSKDLINLKKSLRKHMRPYSPRLEKYVNKIVSRNFFETYKNGLDEIKNAYGNKDTKILGFKEVWTNEFIPSLIRSFKNIKIIQIIRDPRAVIASNYAKKNEKYPLLFLCRQWRKLASLSYLYNEKYKNILNIKYEDLIENTDLVSKEICKFLKIDFDPNILDPSNFKDGNNKSWSQNTSYKNSKNEFNIYSIYKWKKILSKSQIKIIESLCGAEMRLFNYKHSSSSISYISDKNIIKNDIKLKELAKWIRPYSKYNLQNTINMENKRLKYLNKKININELDKNLFFLNKKLYSILSK